MTSRTPSNRWRDASGASLAAQVVGRLLDGEPLDGLHLGRRDGRIDLRGFVIPTPETMGVGDVAEERNGDELAGLGIQWLSGVVEFRNVTLSNLDFSNAQLDHLRFFDVTLENCVFDHAKCRDWRGWNLSVKQCTFRDAILRGSALGTCHNQKNNHYRLVDFSNADLRDIICQAASFIDCEFSNTQLDNVEFGACKFIDCKFSGQLANVRFSAEPMPGIDTTERGSLENVDFSHSTLRWIEFRGLSFNEVTLPPEGDEHVIVNYYPCVVRRAITRLDSELDRDTQALYARMLTDADLLDGSRDIGLWHREELGKTPEQQEIAHQLLHELERQCATADQSESP